MNSPIIQLLVLVGIAIFLILRLRSVLGTREGFEKPPEAKPVEPAGRSARKLEVIEGGPDRDIIDNVPEGSPAATALAAMKRVEPAFRAHDFLIGARAAYEAILMAYENGKLDEVRPWLADDVAAALSDAIAAREAQGHKVEAHFGGISSLRLRDVEFDSTTREADLTVAFVGEMTRVVRDAEGNVIEGSTGELRRQRDVWTFSRKMGSDNPNWLLVATGE